LELSSGNLTGPAEISFPYKPAAVPVGMSPSDFYGISTFDQATNQWLNVPVTVNPTLDLVTAEISHFSWWNPFSWNLSSLGSEISQDALQAIGQRSAAPVCTGASLPSYVGTVDLESDASDPLRSCANTQSGILHVQLTSNRTYGMVMTYGAPVSWGWHGTGGSLLDKALDVLIDQRLGPNQLYIPPLQAASIGIPDTPFGFAIFKAQPTPATVMVDIADLALANVPATGAIVDKMAIDCFSTILMDTAPVTLGDIAGDVEGAAACIKDAVQGVIESGDLTSSQNSALIKDNAKLSVFADYLKLGVIGLELGSTIGNLVLGTTVDTALRQFAVLHANAVTPPTTAPTSTTTTTTTTTVPSAPSFAIGARFDSECVVAWPTAPTITSNSIVMTMTCQNVPEDEFQFTQVTYNDPNLPVTPDTGQMEVIGRVEDVAQSDLGFKELVVQASNITFG
jgi:hypothetical protein